jgi:hypothetical protein
VGAENLFHVAVESPLTISNANITTNLFNVFCLGVDYSPITLTGEKRNIGTAVADILKATEAIELRLTTLDDTAGTLKSWFTNLSALAAPSDGTVNVPADFATRFTIRHAFIDGENGLPDKALFRPGSLEISLSRADRPATSTAASVVPAARAGRVDSGWRAPALADTPKRMAGAGSEARSTNALLGRLIRRIDGHEQRLTKGLKAIERAIEDLTEIMQRSGGRAKAGGGGGGLSGWLGGIGAAIAGWLGLKNGGGLLKSLTGGFKGLLSKIPVGRMGGPLGAILGGAGLASAWGEANADESLTDRDRATQKGTAVGEFGGLLAGGAAGAALGSFLGPVGTVVGGLIGGALGAWGGGKAGETVTETVIDFADTETGMQIAQQWTATTAALRGRWDGLVASGSELFAGLGVKWDGAVEQIQGWFAEASGVLAGFAEQANAWVEDKTRIDVGESVARGVDATTEAVRSGFDRLINLIRPGASGDGSASVEIDDANLTTDLGAGGALRHTATASTTSGATSDVPTLSQATEASALASVGQSGGGSAPGTGLVATTSVGQGEKALLERIAHGEGTSDVKARARLREWLRRVVWVREVFAEGWQKVV